MASCVFFSASLNLVGGIRPDSHFHGDVRLGAANTNREANPFPANVAFSGKTDSFVS